jgi:hypothetical protein
MALSVDWKCGVTNAILTVLVYLLLLKLAGPESGKTMSLSANWYQSLEFLLLVGALVAFNVNSMLFTSCVTSNSNSLNLNL